MKDYVVFYGNQVYGEYNSWNDFRLKTIGEEVYNGGYYHVHNGVPVTGKWYRMDGTPVLLEDVPKKLRTIALILNL